MEQKSQLTQKHIFTYPQKEQKLNVKLNKKKRRHKFCFGE